MDLSVRTLYDQIWAYARFINEAPEYQRDTEWDLSVCATLASKQPASNHQKQH